jgi:hypothetical protein
MPKPLEMKRNHNQLNMRLTHTKIASGGGASQRVSCSHMSVIAVSRPSSVGNVPANPEVGMILSSRPAPPPTSTPVCMSARHSIFGAISKVCYTAPLRATPLARGRIGCAQAEAGGRCGHTGQVRKLIVQPARTGGAQVGVAETVATVYADACYITVVCCADGAHADQRAAHPCVGVNVAAHRHGIGSQRQIETTSQVEGAHVDGRGALTSSSAPSAVPALWAPCRPDCCYPWRWRSPATHPQRRIETNISSGGSACQRVPCSHRNVSAVSCPSSVGTVPARLLLYQVLDITTAPIVQSMKPERQYLKWRGRVASGAVLSRVRHRRQQSQLCRQRARQRIAVKSPVMLSHPVHKSQRSKSTTKFKWREQVSTDAVLSQCFQRRQ